MIHLSLAHHTHAGPHVGPVGGETMHKTPPSMVFCALTAAPCRSSCSATSTCPLEEAVISAVPPTCMTADDEITREYPRVPEIRRRAHADLVLAVDLCAQPEQRDDDLAMAVLGRVPAHSCRREAPHPCRRQVAPCSAARISAVRPLLSRRFARRVLAT